MNMFTHFDWGSARVNFPTIASIFGSSNCNMRGGTNTVITGWWKKSGKIPAPYNDGLLQRMCKDIFPRCVLTGHPVTSPVRGPLPHRCRSLSCTKWFFRHICPPRPPPGKQVATTKRRMMISNKALLSLLVPSYFYVREPRVVCLDNLNIDSLLTDTRLHPYEIDHIKLCFTTDAQWNVNWAPRGATAVSIVAKMLYKVFKLKYFSHIVHP